MNMSKHLLLTIASAAMTAVSWAGNIDDIRQALEQSSVSQVQEKVYLHTDNQCYFVGDTLWYKAYVVRADNLTPTNLSRILYVELLSPDGLVVERQNIAVNHKGYTCGQFVIDDSLYSGFYELRAYTRWMLNFNVRHHRYSKMDTWVFYNRQMAADYFRIWDGLYSRVFPIYSKPEKPGNYDSRRLYQRPKTRLPRVKKDDLIVNFYPEGGHLVEGVENRVAFDITDQHGEAVNTRGTITASGMSDLSVKTEYMGRGTFNVTPDGKSMKGSFRWKDKDWTVSLPKTEDVGVAMRLDGLKLQLTPHDMPADRQYAVSVLCRGALKHFQKVASLASPVTLELPAADLPTGVCDVTLFDDEGRIWADRLFFVNNHDYDQALITAPLVANHTYQPYEKVELPVQLQGVSKPTLFSISIRDTNTDEPTYDDGNIMTDLLLSSELRGFIAHPAYYFKADDEQHHRHLDLLMMVQGWSKYKWTELSDTARYMRYQPETTMTVEGSVYRLPDINPVEQDEVASWQHGTGMTGRRTDDESQVDPWAEEGEDTNVDQVNDDFAVFDNVTDDTGLEYGDIGTANDHIGINHHGLRHEVLVEAEIQVGKEFAGGTQMTRGGRYVFQIPPFYGVGYINLKAYNEGDSVKKNMMSRKDAKVFNEDAFPDYYVKRDLFFPMYTHEYNYYEKHQPENFEELLIDTLSELSMENDVHQLQNVNVRGRRRGRRSVDWSKPAFVYDAYELYNDITDRGLSFGKLDMRQFPVQVGHYLYGNMNRYNTFHVDGRLNGYTYYRNYSPTDANASEAERAGLLENPNSNYAIFKDLKLYRLKDIRVFTDFEPRTEDSTMVEERYSADMTVEMATLPDEGRRITYRDRHIVLRGFNAPAVMYAPDYSDRQPAAPTDYRRTLYWNPNALTDEQGRFTATFFNNSKETRVRMSAAGITPEGHIMHSK